MGLARAWATLFWISFRRLLWSTNTLMVMFPLAACAGVIWILRDRAFDPDMGHGVAFHQFSEFVQVVFISFIVPICALAYGTTSIGGDREDRTLLFLLVRPIPRFWVLLAKFSSSLPLVLGVVVASYFVYCRLAGEVGMLAFQRYLAPVVFMSLAYTGLFHLFAVLFRHSTIVALVYALFVEAFIGNMPGVIKQITVSYYGRSMIYDLGLEQGLTPPDPVLFEPISAQQGAWWLLGIAGVGLVLALVIFARKEYRDLT